MKKLLLVSLVVVLGLILLPTPSIAGPQCTSLGGSCKTSCLYNEVNQGLQDCIPNPKGPSERCCVPDGGAPGGSFLPSTCPCDPDWRPDFCADNPPIRTALGCIPTHPLLFVGQFREILVGLGGGIAFLLMIIGAFFVLTSQGDPERVKRGKEIFVGALVGLLIMIFSVFILQLTFTDILEMFI